MKQWMIIRVLVLYVLTPLWFVASSVFLLRLCFSAHDNSALLFQVSRIAITGLLSVPLAVRGWKLIFQDTDAKLSSFAYIAIWGLLATNAIENIALTPLLHSIHGK